MSRRITASLLTLACGVVFGTTIRPVSLENMASRSTLVAEGKAISSRSQWNASHTMITTYTRFRVSRVLKGGAASEVTIRQPGGSVGAYQVIAHGVRYLKPGEEAALFLQKTGDSDGSMIIVGLVQGMFRIEREASGAAFVSNGARSVETRDESGTAKSFAGSRIPLSDFEARVARVTK